MELNYHHLGLFHAVVREGGVGAAARRLGLSPGTVSKQVGDLEAWAGGALLERDGRAVRPTELGRLVFDYAESVFTLGRELSGAVRYHGSERRPRVVVGLVHSLARHAAVTLLRPFWSHAHSDPPQTPALLVLRTGSLQQLLQELAVYHLDLILSDEHPPAGSPIRTLTHPIHAHHGHASPRAPRHDGLAVMAPESLAVTLRRGFPESLTRAPAVLPSSDSPMRRGLDAWLARRGLELRVAAECQDPTLCKLLSQRGVGYTVVHRFATDEVERSFGLRLVGQLPDVDQQVYVIEARRRREHPMIRAVIHSATRPRRTARPTPLST